MSIKDKNRVAEKITAELLDAGICPACFGALIPNGAHCEVCRSCGYEVGACCEG